MASSSSSSSSPSSSPSLVYSISSMSSSSSSPSSPRWMYDVFLSFQGETRRSFIDHLYTNLCNVGVNTFRDDEEIKKGENISTELLKAIGESRISIIIFSQNYARSKWCLKELVEILKCKENMQQTVLPIFYDVDPSEVRNQTGEFSKALLQHTERFGDQKVDEWKVALTKAANLSGWDLQTMTNRCESKLIEEITEEILRELNHTWMNVAKYPIGINSRAREIIRLLQSQKTKDNVGMIGLYGMGGVGKSTLAKAIYNLIFQKFEGSSFIEIIISDILEGRQNGIVKLQEKLLCETLKRHKFEIANVDKGISLIKERLRSKKVLIVLDGIDHISQLESLAQQDWFGSGSVIILTTRDIHLLSDLKEHEKYMVETLRFDQSLKLLSWHSFGVPKPLDDYAEVCKSVASYTGGLPLAVTVIGSYLRGRSVEEWSINVEKLRSMPHDDVQKVLKISFDALDDDTQNVFLDIACFFLGQDKKESIMILEASRFHAGTGIRTLIERCLLTIKSEFGEDERLHMHDLVRDMGREIVRKESPREPGKRTRLIDPKDVFDVLQSNKGTETIEGIMLKDMSLSTKAFERMVKLRILELDNVQFKGSFAYLSNELRWFKWRNCHLKCIPSNFRFEKLIKLDMSNSSIQEFQASMKNIKCLRILYLNHCKHLKKTPDFTGAQSLQKLSFKSCFNLAGIHKSVGNLENLVELNFWRCFKLKELPNSICKLRSLEVLNVGYCITLKVLPIDFGKLDQLREFIANGTPISHLPFSLGCFQHLKLLALGGVGVKTLTHHSWLRTSCDPANASLYSLEGLDLKGLSFSLCHLSNLEDLYLEDWRNLRAIPELPPNLKKLYARNCVSLEKIANISALKRLEILCIAGCKSLVELPGLESLESLEGFEITNCSALTIPRFENWFQAQYCEGDSVRICVEVLGTFVQCYVQTLLRHKQPIRMIHKAFDDDYLYEFEVSVRNKTTGHWIPMRSTHNYFLDYRPLHCDGTIRLERECPEWAVEKDECKGIRFEVPIMGGEELELEVYAEFDYPSQILCLCELHRDRDGQVCFFPSTRGYLEVDETTVSFYGQEVQMIIY
ncbi:PREDICTED: disease resistance protein TAO1-like [Ipomoea nil]|uniref:disease resistance protein TAO1-like n=1 Tax=Ipomoea nil TaxID=35883 RepID=UPI0009009E6A|nr:PREDICTED: disease resistance protein TAO1-like [Ipomoea nil]